MEAGYQMGDEAPNEDEMDYGQMPEGYNEEGQEADENGDEYAQFAFPSFSPTSRKRVRLRKPNFSDECIDLLIELVNEHRDILYTKKAYTNDVHEKKIMVWTHITSKINAISSIPRTMEEVRKKWNDYSYYVKKKRENEKRGIHYTPDTRTEQYDGEEEAVEGGRKVLKRDSKKIRRREDRVLVIVEAAARDGGMGDGGDTFGPNDSSSLLSTRNETENHDPSYDPTFDDEDEDDESEAEVETLRPPASRNIPRSTIVPPLPNPISNYGYSGRGSYSRGRGNVRRSSRVKNPTNSPYAPTPGTRGRGRGRGRPPLSAQHGTRHVSPVDEDLVLVNKQLLAMERKMLNVEKKRLQIELRKLEIEEERFKWEMAERGKIYSETEQDQEEENQEEAAEEESENQNTSQDTETETEQQENVVNNDENTMANSEEQQPEQQQQQEEQHQPEEEQQQQNGLSLQDVCSPVKYETRSPEETPQPHSPIVITTETPSLTPVDETF